MKLHLMDDNVLACVVETGRFAGIATSWMIDLNTLFHNLAVAGALCAAFELGVNAAEMWTRTPNAWQPNVRGEPIP